TRCVVLASWTRGRRAERPLDLANTEGAGRDVHSRGPPPGGGVRLCDPQAARPHRRPGADGEHGLPDPGTPRRRRPHPGSEPALVPGTAPALLPADLRRPAPAVADGRILAVAGRGRLRSPRREKDGLRCHLRKDWSTRTSRRWSGTCGRPATRPTRSPRPR